MGFNTDLELKQKSQCVGFSYDLKSYNSAEFKRRGQTFNQKADPSSLGNPAMCNQDLMLC